MSQHDYNIANQGFPNFRTDLNNALGAIATNNSGSTAPTTTFAHQWWLDTSTTPTTLRQRNADNDAWVTIGTIDQATDTFVPANASSDKISEGNSSVEVVDTGTGYVVVTVDGGEVARFNPDQLVTKAGSASTPAISPTGDLNTGVFFPAADTIAFGEGGAEAMRIDSSGNLLVGTTTTPSLSGIALGTSSTGKNLTVFSSSSGNNGLVKFIDPNGSASLEFVGGTTGISIYGYGSRPMTFWTNGTERLTIPSDSAGIKFPATQAASSDANTLDDYEEGTWTPSLGGTTTYTNQEGTYTKVGRQVTVRGKINVNTIGTGSTYTLSGMPFSAATNYMGSVYWGNSPSSLVYATLLTNADTTATIYSATGATGTLSNNAVWGSGCNVIFTVTYFV